VLDGGLQAWLKAGGAVESGEPERAARAAAFVPRPDAAAVVTTAELVEALEGRRRLLVDARAPERFAGTFEPIDPVAGHVPGAINHLSPSTCARTGNSCRNANSRAAGASGWRARRPPRDRHVRLGRHRLPQPARAGVGGTAGRKALRGLMERVDPRSETSNRARLTQTGLRAPGSAPGRARITRRRHASSDLIRVLSVIYMQHQFVMVRHMNTPAKMLGTNLAWKVEQSLDLYQVEAWGKGYFSINADGHVVIRPSMDASREIDLLDVVQGLKARDLHTPVVIRFSDISRIGCVISPRRSDRHHGERLQNRYAAVFPIKVNQQRLVVEEVYRYGKAFGFGLEVGSKPELLAVMSITEDEPDRMVIATASKDDSYIEAVTIAAKLGRNIIPWSRITKKFM